MSWNELQAGDRVRTIDGVPGTIVELIPDTEFLDNPQNRIVIEWAGAAKPSTVLHDVCRRVIFVSRCLKKISLIASGDAPICATCKQELVNFGREVGEDKDGIIYEGHCLDHGRQFFQFHRSSV